ncbi:hypothetical protein [Desulfallas thermosapovorans]|uniref:hypothetical protein n=1 Tax=Desulfallas thermosapovorans TaxID=58137 RepID=UPI0014134CCE|nr:hypothetical protein [Desulfallas thermosapovorans]
MRKQGCATPPLVLFRRLALLCLLVLSPIGVAPGIYAAFSMVPFLRWYLSGTKVYSPALL